MNIKNIRNILQQLIGTLILDVDGGYDVSEGGGDVATCSGPLHILHHGLGVNLGLAFQYSDTETVFLSAASSDVINYC